MTFDRLTANSPAGQALARILRLALPDEDARLRALQGALRSAKRAELPTDGDELLALVRAHLAPHLSKDVAPNLVFALIDDLKAEIEQQRAGKETSSSRLRAATCFPPAAAPPAADGVAQRGADEPRSSGSPRASADDSAPFPKLRASVTHLRRTTAASLRAATAASAPRAEGAVPAPVVLVEPDRMMRASLARSLVGARFDVSVLEAMPELSAWLHDHADEAAVVVVDVARDGVDAGLRALAARHRKVSIVAWTDAPAGAVGSSLAAAGVRRFRVVPRASPAADVIEQVRSLSLGGG